MAILMTTSDYALITSLVSIVIAIGSLLWNVWQKFIFVKPTLQVSFGIYNVLVPTETGTATRTGHRLLNLTVTNMGPGPVILFACIGKPKTAWWKRPKKLGLLNPIHGDPLHPKPESIGPFSSGLPTKIDASETKSFYFPYTKDCFLSEQLASVGVNDTYQRNTWCRSRDMHKVNMSYRRDFAK
jgi:hypothetical protein